MARRGHQVNMGALAAVCLILGCGIAGLRAPEPVANPCTLHEDAPDDFALLRADVEVLMIDHRPVVVPLAERAAAGCDVYAYRLPSGRHTIHTIFQSAGYSPFVAVAYDSQSCSFVAEASGRYRVQQGCTVMDLKRDNVVGRASGLSHHAYFESIRAYAACDDPTARRDFEHYRDHARVSLPARDWVIGPCRAWIDLR